MISRKSLFWEFCSISKGCVFLTRVDIKIYMASLLLTKDAISDSTSCKMSNVSVVSQVIYLHFLLRQVHSQRQMRVVLILSDSPREWMGTAKKSQEDSPKQGIGRLYEYLISTL